MGDFAVLQLSPQVVRMTGVSRLINVDDELTDFLQTAAVGLAAVQLQRFVGQLVVAQTVRTRLRSGRLARPIVIDPRGRTVAPQLGRQHFTEITQNFVSFFVFLLSIRCELLCSRLACIGGIVWRRESEEESQFERLRLPYGLKFGLLAVSTKF